MSNEIANLQRNRWRFAASVVLVMGAVVGVVAYTQARLKSEVLDNHVELARADARNLEDFLTQGLKSTDLLLQGLSESATLTPSSCPNAWWKRCGRFPCCAPSHSWTRNIACNSPPIRPMWVWR